MVDTGSHTCASTYLEHQGTLLGCLGTRVPTLQSADGCIPALHPFGLLSDVFKPSHNHGFAPPFLSAVDKQGSKQVRRQRRCLPPLVLYAARQQGNSGTPWRQCSLSRTSETSMDRLRVALVHGHHPERRAEGRRRGRLRGRGRGQSRKGRRHLLVDGGMSPQKVHKLDVIPRRQSRLLWS